MSDTAAVRQFIKDHFSEDDFNDLAFDFFPDVYNEFAAGMTRSQKIRLLVDHARQQEAHWQRLLGALERLRPDAYRDRLADLAFPSWAAQLNMDALSPAEKEVMKWMFQGLSLEQTAYRLNMSRYSASRYRKAILDKVKRANPILNTSTLAAVTPISRVEAPPPAQDVPLEHVPDSLVQLGDGRYYHIKTGMEMIYVPAGPFLYGDTKEKRDLDAFWIGRNPVTNAHYKLFLDANLDRRVPFGEEEFAEPYNWDPAGRTYPPDRADHPVVLVSWHDAAAFCAWAGLSLPAEEQWEKAARGTGGRVYPWGDDEPTADRCNFNNHVGTTTPAGRYSPQGDSPYGCADMAGNVYEWTNSWYVPGQPWRALRGGSFANHDWGTRAALRVDAYPDGWNYDVGFRVIGPLAISGP